MRTTTILVTAVSCVVALLGESARTASSVYMERSGPYEQHAHYWTEEGLQYSTPSQFRSRFDNLEPLVTPLSEAATSFNLLQQDYFAPAEFGGQGISTGFPDTFQHALPPRYLPTTGISGHGIIPGSPNGFNQPAIYQLGPQNLEVPSAMSYTDPKRNLAIRFTYTPVNKFTDGFNLNFEITNGKGECTILSFSSTAGKGGVSTGIQGLLTTVLEGINKTIFQYAGKTPKENLRGYSYLPVHVDVSMRVSMDQENPGSTGTLHDLPGGPDMTPPPNCTVNCPDGSPKTGAVTTSPKLIPSPMINPNLLYPPLLSTYRSF